MCTACQINEFLYNKDKLSIGAMNLTKVADELVLKTNKNFTIQIHHTGKLATHIFKKIYFALKTSFEC